MADDFVRLDDPLAHMLSATLRPMNLTVGSIDLPNSGIQRGRARL